MNITEVAKITYESGLVQESMKYSFVEAVAIIAMLGFIVWNFKLVYDPVGAPIPAKEDLKELKANTL
ncbi:hypothetical protein [Cetobacterium sp. SF1]|uniref:hypothetical protein n=1 Tax=Cetobacterium sp. SF1 TaxID=3417654 RepID=UPI003CF2C1C8